MKIGVIVILNSSTNIISEFSKLKNTGFDNCQLVCWDSSIFNDEKAEEVKKAALDFGIQITAVWVGWQAPAVWNFYEGHLTLGLVPETYRFARAQRFLEGADFANKLGVKNVVTHAGFIPENPYDKDYAGLISILKYICNELNKNNQNFLFETGQETPITLLRAIEDIDLPNVFVNLDPANLLLYGKANPVDAVHILGKYIKGVHAKDGEYPTNGKFLGEEKPIGHGSVNFKNLIKALKDVSYEGTLTIENEIFDDKHAEIILESKNLLEDIIKSI